MATMVKVAKTGMIPENEGLVVQVNGRPVAIFNKGGMYYATDDTCPHQGGSLGQGELEDDIVVCPYHEWKFNIKTGASHEIPGFNIETFQVEIKGEDIYILM